MAAPLEARRSASHVGGRPRRRSADQGASRDDGHRGAGSAAGYESADLPAPRWRLIRVGRGRGISVTTIGASVAIVIFLMLTLAVPVRTYIAQRNEFSELQQSNAELRDEAQEYRNKLAQQNDPAYIEKEARARLGYVREGEKPVVVIDPSRDAQERAERAERKRNETPWYEQLMDAVSTPPNE
ncbi:FtsB family cell division protein [Gordonia shandongensis]|uniref:FtsB family cell division protein n=1 Tax=Gordonia shandongensis TaxID=376351 RepID=UPI001FDF17F2|nr:septum formation initiator family protein [Gordonia shandongensis]